MTEKPKPYIETVAPLLLVLGTLTLASADIAPHVPDSLAYVPEASQLPEPRLSARLPRK